MSNLSHKAAQFGLAFTSFFLFSYAPVQAFAEPSVSRGGMPIAFEQNQGQAASGIRFISRGTSGILMLSDDQIALRARGQASAFRLKLNGASSNVSIQGSGEKGGVVNYLRGTQPSQWLTNIPSYSKVTYKNVYPQIDLIVYGNEGQFESDFALSQGADPSVISLQLDGKLDIREDGSLAVQSAGGAFHLHRPFVYQLTAGGERVAVESRYTVGKGNKIGFALGQYDRSKPLVIDPVLSYSTYLGGSGDDSILGMAGDLFGNVYVTGQTTSLNFPTAFPRETKKTTGSDSDCFVSKFDPTGQHLIYSTYLGGSANDKCTGVAVNIFGEAFVGGTTSSTDFPTKNALQNSLNGSSNGFVAHLDWTGCNLVFSTYLGGGGEFLTGVALDLASNVYVTGLTGAANFPVTPGAYQTKYVKSSAYASDAFLSKISCDGSHLIYSTFLGGTTNYDSANGVAVDLFGSAYLTGEAHSTDFPTKNAYQSTLKGSVANAFVSKFSADGSSLVYSTLIGGSTYDSARSIAIDLSGNAYITGSTTSTNFPTVNAVQTTLPGQMTGIGQSSIFVLKLNSTGSSLAYSTYFGGAGFDYPFNISVDLFGNAAVKGETSSTNFPLKAAVQTVYGGGYADAFVANFANNGTLNYSTYLGGSGGDAAFAGYTDLLGCVWVGGNTSSTNYPLKSPYQGTFGGSSDAFFSRLQ